MKYLYFFILLIIPSILFGQNNQNELNGWLDKLNNWIEQEQLSFIKIDYEKSIFNDTLKVHINIVHLDDAMRNGDNDYLPMYFQFFYKIHRISGINQNMIKVQFNDSKGYCNVGILRTIIFLDDSYAIEYKQDYLPPTTHYSCMLDFEAIFKMEQETKEEYIKANNSSKFGLNQALNEDKPKLFVVKKYLEHKFPKDNAVLTFTNVSDNYISLEIRNIQSVVLYDKSYWEKIQIAFILYELPNDYLKLLLFIDGQYAAGLASPPDLSFIDMEPKYSNYLLKFGKTILLDAKNELLSEK